MTQMQLLIQVNETMTKFRAERLRHQVNTGEFLPDEFPDHLTREAEAAAIIAAVRKHDPFIRRAVEALNEAREFIDGQIDVVDGSYGEPSPNRAMTLASTIDEAIAPLTH